MIDTQSANQQSETTVLPSSYAQQRLWFLDRLEPGRAVYNVPLAKRLRGPLDVDALARALSALVERHEALRTTFTVVDGEPQQVIEPSQPIRLERTDLRTHPDAERQAAVLLDRHASAPFDLARGPLIRAALICLGSEDHVLILTLHHIIVDGWSLGVLSRELAALYNGFVAGQPTELSELPIQYADYASWQREWIGSGGLAPQLGFWADRLAGAPPVLELATDRPRPPRQSYRGATERALFPLDLLGRVRGFSARQGSTTFITLLAAFSVLLSRWSGEADLVIASPVANRNRVELEGVVGLFVNTVALRVDLDGEPSFSELTTRVRGTVLDAFSNQELPFERLVEELNPQRDLRHAPLAQVMFVLQGTTEPAAAWAGLEHEPIATDRATAKFDLMMVVSETGDGLRVSLEYSTDLFDRDTISRMLGHYRNLLENAVAGPDQQISQLRLLDEVERRAALAASNGTGVEHPVACLHELFELRAVQTPDAVAVTCDGLSISYEELNRRANQLAHRLRALEAGPETLIALALEPSVEMTVAIVGVLKAGAAYVPLDPEYPSERLRFVLADTRARIVVAQQRVLDRVPVLDADVQVVLVDTDDETFSGERADNPAPLATPENLAYVIYTSGSTGQPKGVQVEHRQVARLFSATDAWYGFGPADTFTLLHSYAFDFSVWELWGALLHGGRLVVSPRLTTRSPQALVKLIVDEHVTVLNATPSLFAAIQPELLRRGDQLALRTVIFGGEALTPATLRPWFDRFDGSGPTLVNMYGITETTVHVTYRPVVATDCDGSESPIGSPIPDLSVYLLDRSGEPVPAGIAGEMFVGGAGVTRGYLNRPELNAERFIDNPFGSGRLYRSGDVARRLRTGELDFRGRIDDQVKIRGFRIELGEIRVAVGAHPDVKEAAVVVSESADDARLVAYIVPSDPASPPSADGLRAFVAGQLPEYMVPAGWMFLDALPLTRNGKVDSKSLPQPEYDRSAAGREFIAPATKTERELAQVWSDVLGIKNVGTADNFFELGGHSMLAVRLFADIERRMGARLPLSALFETATIAGLAEIIDRDRGSEAAWSSLVPMRRGNGQRPLFLVAWAGGEVLPYRDLVERLDPDLPVYGLRAPGVDRRTPPLASVEELATHYVTEVRKAQAHGPYRLGGYCFSGLVAYEMARQLVEQDEAVDLVALLDSYPHRGAPRPGRLEIERVKWQAFRSSSIGGKWAWVRRRAVGAVHKARNAVYETKGPRVYELLAARNLQHRIPRRPWNLVLVASNLARRRYKPRPLDVRIAFFRAQRSHHRRPTPWDNLAGGGVELRSIVAADINHERMMHEPHVRTLAAELQELLDG